MITLPDPTTLPNTAEGVADYQSAVNARRAEQTASFKPEEKAQMAIIEAVSKQLEDAKIPFALWANPLNTETGTCFWRFSRLEYLPESAPFSERASLLMRTLYWRLAPTMSEWMLKAFGVKYASFYDEERKPLFAYDMTGERTAIMVIKDKDEKSDEPAAAKEEASA